MGTACAKEPVTSEEMAVVPTTRVLEDITKEVAKMENREDTEEPETIAQQEDNIGDHFCPIIGGSSVGEECSQAFVNNNMLHKLFDAAEEEMAKNFNMDKDSALKSIMEGSCGIALAVSDPNTMDCPLIYISPGFEDLTGYTTSAVVGRSCRFLQPTSRPLNDGINLGERTIMRDFCNNLQKRGHTIINLLLNERVTGERFWNLLRMQYVEVEGAKYIFGVQTTLEAFMPKALQKRVMGPSKNQKLVEALEPFIHCLDNMRTEIAKSYYTPILELKAKYEKALNMLEQLPMFGYSSIPESPKPVAVEDAPADAKALPDVPKAAAATAKPSQKDAPKTDDNAITVGSTVIMTMAVKYASHKVPKDTVGKVISIDSFGNATIEWEGLGKKGFLARDFAKLKLKSK
eukprot:gnl/TRDRNA2_/TRDRNA2_33544_c0_seq1.p1 gnl/TRDRNA2_/TRDRNA2_33544_c0~~gnl/TRDRNA2_/TRDRNA2_33544_c0_seq1.p1  ORF type:complete len:403 (-),score=103.17 gnl/TRDRNA2_/TRDRNA2_33544_c0_seq1:37-1245(-)